MGERHVAIPRPIYLFFFLSGASGLVYQVIWIREFGLVFGNTVYSASLVTAVFMCGLGVGGLIAGRWADKLYRKSSSAPLAAYGHFELVIALLGLGIALLLPSLEGFSAAISSYAVGEPRWFELSTGSQLARYGLAALLLMPITALMGGTLTLVIRGAVHDDDATAAGWRIGLLYGLNTLGAALGCFLVDFVFIPRFGLFGTQGVAIVLNLIAALGALRIARDLPARPARPATVEATGGVSRAMLSIAGAVFFCGLIGMGLEIVWFRFLSSVLGGTRAVFSLLLAVILIGMWAGSTSGGYLARRFGHPVRWLIFAQAALIVSTLWLVATFDVGALRALGDRWEGEGGRLLETMYALHAIVPVVALPSLLLGFSFPLANAAIQAASASVGKRAGALYLANTLGAVLGSLLTGFVLLPRLGMQSVLTVITTFALASIVLLAIASAERKAALYGVFLVAVAMIGWLRLAPDHLVLRTFAEVDGKVIDVSEGIGESIVVSERTEDGKTFRTLNTNGHSMSDTSPIAMRYMRAFVHVPLLMLEAPQRVLVICFGVGNTAHSASLHPSLSEIHIADLSRHVLSHASFFTSTNHDVLADPRVSVFVNDGR